MREVPDRPRVSVVVLTRGDRAAALDRAVTSAQRQRDVDVELIVVWNGCSEPVGGAWTNPLVRDVHLAENLGIPEGRNVGASHATGTVLFFLDDDAEIVGHEVLARMVERFERVPRLGVIGARIVDEAGETAQRHVPRWGRSSASRSGEVTTFLGGVVAIRREAFVEVGGYASEFFYAMEETDLAWRLLDADWSIWYDADLVVQHPRTDPSRHPDAVRHTARNRVWLVHRTLPVVLGAVYLFNWLAVTTLRSPASAPATVRGYREGWHSRVGPRRPIRWSTVLRLTRLGRPPIL